MPTNFSKSSGPSSKTLIITLLVLIGLIILFIFILLARKGKLNNSSVPVDSQNNNPSVETSNEAGQLTNANQSSLLPAGAKVEVVGASPVLDGVVITATGAPAKSSALPMSPEAPKQSAPVRPEDIPETAVKLEIGGNSFKPASFQVSPGAPVTLSLTSKDGKHHVLVFDSPALSAVAISVLANQTKAISFNAPLERGEYAFHCDIPFHADSGEKGVMIVK